MSTKIEHFVLSVPQSDLDDLQNRLQHARFPEPETVADTSQGPQLAKIKALVERWQGGYDWRRCEALLNGFGQYRTEIDGLGIHFLHVRSPEPDALPLLMTHGWPGSVLEFRKVIGLLTNPAAHGGDPRQAFHLVMPSLPGFGFSDKPTSAGWGIPQIADAWVELMRRLGYPRWGAQGGDIGAAVTDAIARSNPAGLVGIHLNFVMFQPTPEEMKDASPEEQAMLASAKYYWDVLSGYAKQQMTRPQTIGYALADSPVGQAAWIYAMFQDICGKPGDAEATFTLDEMLDDILLYWLPNTGASSAKLYWEMSQGMMQATQPPPVVTVPAGFSMFPGELVRKSRRWIEKRYSNTIYFNQPEQGGHFAALEQPAIFAQDVQKTFAALR